MDGAPTTIANDVRHYPLLFEMLRSFTTLAETLNLSEAERRLGSTRQTVRRHIAQLEEAKGGTLFNVTDRRYELSPLGQVLLPEALELQALAECWLDGRSGLTRGLQTIQHDTPEFVMYQQQHPISRAFRDKDGLLPRVIRAWAEANGELEHPAMETVRPWLMVFRRSGDTWICVELGEESSYATWFGWANARSSIGRPLGQMPGGDTFARLANMAYEEVEANHGLRLDHAFTRVPREAGGPPVPLSYERLLLGSRFPDGSFAMLLAVRRTLDIEVDRAPETTPRMTSDLIMAP